AFMDTCGRDLDRSDKLASLNISTYIAGAAGILFLVDPLQVPAIRRGLGLPEADDLPSPAERLGYIAEIIRDKTKLKARAGIDIPLAVVLTKSDLLTKAVQGGVDEDVTFGPESSLHIAREYGSPDMENLALVGSEVQEYLRRMLGEEFMDSVGNFNRHEFFAVSALGGETSEGSLTKGISPSRVEDPLIWFFNEDRRKRL
ncbi:MAG: hypothetical protein MJZ38_01965, partial [archaeon]|nr:hypothetical protein [archaeon]